MSGAVATILTPYSWGSPAVELANRVWRKRILPVGDIDYQGRKLHFTPSYLKGLADAFNDRAYDQVSFQLADAGNAHTNDPERHRGYITDLQLADDGLYITAQVTEAGEQVLSVNPGLGVSARIVEHYSRSDGKYYPAAIQHVLGTLDPRIPALGPWQPVEMANGGGLMIDLSQAGWAGDPGPVTSPVTLPEQAYELLAAKMALSGGYDAFRELDDGGGGSYELANIYRDFERSFDLANATEVARIEQDAQPRARHSEDRLATALGRIAAGTFTPQGSAAVYAFAAAAQGSSTGMATCGPADDLGYCRERFHAAGCGSSADPQGALALKNEGVYARLAMAAALDADGLASVDAEFGSAMTWTDMIEAATGQRLGDASLWESHRGRRRPVAQVRREQVFGDPDDPEIRGQYVPAATAATAAALARQAGIPTPADARAGRDAAIRQRSRQLARLRPPRHADYAEFSNPVPRQPPPLVQFEEAWNGSLPGYTR